MKKVNFNEIVIKTIDDKEQKVSIANELGNIMYMRGENIEECELGRTIYNNAKSNAETEVDEKQTQIVKKYVAQYPYVVRSAVEAMLK